MQNFKNQIALQYEHFRIFFTDREPHSLRIFFTDLLKVNITGRKSVRNTFCGIC